jgi:Mg-chelatase subunit ChlD
MKNYFALIILLIFTINSNAQNLKKMGFIFDAKTYDFGDVEQWHNQPAIYNFTNKTKHPVSILPLFNENDLDVVIPERPIKVGESVVIKAMYYTAGKGHFSRKFSIYFGSLSEPIILKVAGNIKSLSPEAYINCPMSKPELAKAKIELIGDIAEIDTEIPLSGTSITIIGLQNKKNITLYSSNKGRFGAKLPVGNYQITVNHPNYYSYTGPFYIGQTSPPLRIRLTPIVENPVFAHNNAPLDYKKTRIKEDTDDVNTKEDKLKTIDKKKELEKVAVPKKVEKTKEVIQDKPISKKEAPRDSPYSRKEKEEEVPHTLTTYKESEAKEPKKDIREEEKNTFGEKEEPFNREENVKEPIKNEKPKETPVKEYETAETIYAENPPKKEEPKEVEKREPEEKIKKEKPVKPEKPVIPTDLYTFRVIDKTTMEPIADASIYIFDIYNKSNKHKGNSDERGYSEMEITKEDYRFIASADGYISNEIRILRDDRSDLFRIELAPVSSLYDEIYEAKKAQQLEDKDILDKLSFGKTTFSFAKDEPTTSDEDKTPELLATNHEEPVSELKDIEADLVKEEALRKENAIKLEKAEQALPTEEKEAKLARIVLNEKESERKKKEDSLKLVIAQLALENQNKEEELAKVNENKEEEIAKLKEQEKVDSLNNYIAQLVAKNNNLEKDLDKINTEKDDLADKNNKNKETIEDLNAKNKELEQPIDKSVLSKNQYAANNIIFLIDVSTSMAKAKKMEMLQNSIKNLSSVLRDIDRVAIIAYNQKSNVVLESISGNNKEEIFTAIDSLKTGGLTNGVRGLTAAYEMLDYYYIPNGNNQIILATDGLFSKYNNEMTETELNKLVKKKAEKNMKLTVVGFGKDEEGKGLMTKLAKNGTGQYIQIKNEWMTKDVLIKEVQLNSKK